MSWKSYYQGDGVPRQVELDPPPPWREFPRQSEGAVFQTPPGLADSVNAALCLRRPLLVTGAPGSGKSTIIESVASELELGPVLRWNITSRSTLTDALYEYDVLGRIHSQQLKQSDDISLFLRLGPLGTAMAPWPRPRALLIDEIDKSDLDLAGDLLNVLERGEFEIRELSRYEHDVVGVRPADDGAPVEISRGRVVCSQFPFIVMTSNGEREFPAPFLRRCIRYTMPTPTPDILDRVIRARLGLNAAPAIANELVRAFYERLTAGENLAVDQLLNAVFLLSDAEKPNAEHPQHLLDLIRRDILRDLSRT